MLSATYLNKRTALLLPSCVIERDENISNTPKGGKYLRHILHGVSPYDRERRYGRRTSHVSKASKALPLRSFLAAGAPQIVSAGAPHLGVAPDRLYRIAEQAPDDQFLGARLAQYGNCTTRQHSTLPLRSGAVTSELVSSLASRALLPPVLPQPVRP